MTRTEIEGLTEQLMSIHEEMPQRHRVVSLALLKATSAIIKLRNAEIAELKQKLEELRDCVHSNLGGCTGCSECGMSGVVISCSTCGADKEGNR